MQFFKISVLGLRFFSTANFLSCLSTDLHQILHERLFSHAINNQESDFWNVQKPAQNGHKTSKIGQIFAPAVTFSLILESNE